MRYAYLCIFVCLALSGCTHDYNPQHLKLADRSIRFADIKSNPAAFVGRTVLVGGVLASVNNSPEGGVLEVVQHDLTDDNVPKRSEESGGRFLATTAEFFTDTFEAGQLITLVGEIRGKKTVRVEDSERVYPVIAIKDMHVWRSAEEDGYKVPGTYDPYYWGYPGNPYKDRPVGLPLKPFY